LRPPITPLPSPEQAEALLVAAGLALRDYVDEEKLLICLAIKERSDEPQNEPNFLTL